MNNLHGALAPVSDRAWAQIEDEASRTPKRHLTAPRVGDVQGQKGLDFSAVGTGHLRQNTTPGGLVQPDTTLCLVYFCDGGIKRLFESLVRTVSFPATLRIQFCLWPKACFPVCPLEAVLRALRRLAFQGCDCDRAFPKTKASLFLYHGADYVEEIE